eukprot:6483952-Amphidinium_carterae.1
MSPGICLVEGVIEATRVWRAHRKDLVAQAIVLPSMPDWERATFAETTVALEAEEAGHKGSTPVRLSTTAFVVPISGAQVQLRQQTVEIKVESTFAAVLRVQADPDTRAHLVQDWEGELLSILRLATSQPEAALLETWSPQGFGAEAALAKVKSAQLPEVLRHAHRRGVFTSTPKDHEASYQAVWLQQRACSYTEAVACLAEFPGHAGLIMWRQKAKTDFAMRVPADQLQAAQQALHFDVRGKFIARSVPRVLERPDIDKVLKSMRWEANADHVLNSFGQTAAWLIRSHEGPPQASIVLEISGRKHTITLDQYVEPSPAPAKAKPAATWQSKVHARLGSAAEDCPLQAAYSLSTAPAPVFAIHGDTEPDEPEIWPHVAKVPSDTRRL